MSVAARKDATSVYMGGLASSPLDVNKTRKRQSLFRYWSRLSSLQRSILCLMLIFGSLSALYIVPTIYVDYSSIQQVARQDPDVAAEVEREDLGLVQIDLPRGPPPEDGEMENSRRDREKQKADKFAADAVKLVKRQARLERRNRTRLRSRKAGEAKKRYHFTGPTNPRMEAVVGAFRHSWSGYKRYAWGHDELLPLSKSYGEWFGLGLTLIDALDTMYIMGLDPEFDEARRWVAQNLTYDTSRDVNLFECTIRVLGGLLSAYHLSADPIFLNKSQELGDRLMAAFKSRSAVPYSDVNLKERTAHAPRWGPDSSTSEVTTIQLEFNDLSRATGVDKYADAVNAVSRHVHGLPKNNGLVPIFINADSGQFRNQGTITFGARGDSYYEYLLKMWIQSDQTNNMARDDFIEAMEGMKKHLLRRSSPSNLLYVGELLNGHSFSPKMDHLVCFLAGSLALAGHYGLGGGAGGDMGGASSDEGGEYLKLGKELAETCYEMYRSQVTGLSPEIVYFNTAPEGKSDIFVKPADTHNLLRPETVESLFYLYRLTGNKTYQDWGWNIFKAFEKYTKLPIGYTSIGNVQSTTNVQYRNKMETFWLGETLKYLYLLFSDDKQLISLDEFVFNTEGHVMPIRDT